MSFLGRDIVVFFREGHRCLFEGGTSLSFLESERWALTQPCKITKGLTQHVYHGGIVLQESEVVLVVIVVVVVVVVIVGCRW